MTENLNAGDGSNTGAVAGAVATGVLLTLCLLCVVGCCMCRWCIRTGRCPKRLRVLLAGYTFEAALISKKKLVNTFPMQPAAGGDDDNETCIAQSETASEAGDSRKRNSTWWLSSTSTRISSGEHSPSRPRPTSPRQFKSRLSGCSPGFVSTCSDSSLFPPDTVWEDAAMEDSASCPDTHRHSKRSVFDPRAFFAKDSVRSTRTSADPTRNPGAKAPRMKRCRMNRRSNESSASLVISDTASESGMSETGSIQSVGRARRANCNNQLGWLMRAEAEGAFLETRPQPQPGASTSVDGITLSTLGSPTTEQEVFYSPKSEATTEQSSLLTPRSQLTDDLQFSMASSRNVSVDDDDLTPRMDGEAISRGLLHELTQSREGANLVAPAPVRAASAFARQDPPPGLPPGFAPQTPEGALEEHGTVPDLLREDSAVVDSVEDSNAAQLHDASVRDIKLFIAKQSSNLHRV